MKKLLIAIIVIVILVAGFFIVRKLLTKKTSQVQFTTVEVKKGNIEVKVLSTGTIQPYTRVAVNSPVSGRIEQVLVDEGERVKPRDILAWISSEDRIALLDAARSALESAQKQNDPQALSQAQEAYQIAEKAYKLVPLTNSIAGEVIMRSAEPGQNVNPQTTIFVISDRLLANVTVDEADIGKIALNQQAVITLDAYPNEGVPAKVTKISREGQTVSNIVVYNVMVEPAKVPSYWASGMTANVEFIIVKKDDVLVLPLSVIKQKNGKKTVLVPKGKEHETRVIETGETDGKSIEIKSGLNLGDVVLVSASQNPGLPGSDSDSERRMRQMMRGIR
ncbi:MAG: efflux RND transporter periplasmic adaptor subunit [Candidatus Latescibacteria bacterium]|nr:efflux RND transporter periplasmic adaptor subunit [Candidatus Latescibacterota bacterium]